MDIQTKDTDQCLPVVLFNMLNNLVLTLRFRLCMKSKSVTIQMKATEYFPVAQFIIAYKVALTFETVYKTIQMKATDQYFPVVLFIMLYKVVLTFESVNEILKCDHSNESH